MKSDYGIFSEANPNSNPMWHLSADEQYLCNNYIRKSGGYLEVLLFGIPGQNLVSKALMLEKNYPSIHHKLLVENPKLLGKEYLEANYPYLKKIEEMVGTEQTEWIVMKGLQWGYSNLLQGVCLKHYPADGWIPSLVEKYTMGFLDMKASEVGICPPQEIEIISHKNRTEIEAILECLEKSGIRLVNKMPYYC